MLSLTVAAGRNLFKRTRHIWPLLGGLLVACQVSAPAVTGADPVLPAEDILESGPTVTNITPTSVTILAESRISLVCAVAYGPTTEYGSLATDSDMDVGGHTDHHPVLTGLVPDTEYHFRFGGFGPDGTLYLSQDYTFRTAPAEEGAAAPPGVNVTAQAVILEVSSNWNGGANDSRFGANNATDGDLGTEWSSDGDGDDAFITLDLGAERRVTGVGFATRTMGTSAEISAFTVTTDGGETFGPFELNDPGIMQYFAFESAARALRFDVVRSSGGNTGVLEIEVYAEP